jgi:hypothetical protein
MTFQLEFMLQHAHRGDAPMDTVSREFQPLKPGPSRSREAEFRTNVVKFIEVSKEQQP